MRVELGTLDFADNEPDGQGDHHAVSRLDGWWGSPPASQDQVEPAATWGTRVAGTRLRGRPLVLAGISVAGAGRTGSQVEEKLRGVYAALAGGPVALLVHEDSITRRAQVVRGGSGMRGRLAHNRFEWEMDLLAPDPRKYEDAVLTHTMTLNAGVTTLDQALVPGGSYETVPHLIEVSGSHGGMVNIVNQTTGQGHYLTLAGASTAVDLSPQEGDVSVGRGARSPSSEWYTLLAAGNTIRVTRASGTGSLVVTHSYRKAHL